MKQIIEVGMGGSRIANSPDVLYAKYLEPCVAIGVLDKERKKGYMYHNVDVFQEDLDEFLMLAFQNASPTNLRAYVTGNSARSSDSKEYREEIHGLRDTVHSVADCYFPVSQREYHWLPDDSWGTLAVDTESGNMSSQSHKAGDDRRELKLEIFSLNPKNPYRFNTK